MILDENQARLALERALGTAQKTLIIFSAFVKSKAFEWLVPQVIEKHLKVKIMARWDINDLLSGVSDLSIYERCKELNWEFRVNTALHSKLYLIDSSIGYLGSNNLTGAGLGLNTNNNIEFSTEIRPNMDDLQKIDKYLNSSTLMNDELYEEIKQFVEDNKTTKERIKWPDSIMDKLKTNTDYLWVDNFPLSNPLKDDFYEEFHRDEKIFANIAFDDKETLKDAFMSSHVTQWIMKHLNEQEEKVLFFGSLSALIHNSLLNDPKPYRKEIKDLIANFFAWVQYLELKELIVEQPNHSQCLKLRNYQRN